MKPKDIEKTILLITFSPMSYNLLPRDFLILEEENYKKQRSKKDKIIKTITAIMVT